MQQRSGRIPELMIWVALGLEPGQRRNAQFIILQREDNVDFEIAQDVIHTFEILEVNGLDFAPICLCSSLKIVVLPRPVPPHKR